MACPESIEILKQIRDGISNPEHYTNQKDGLWTVTRVGRYLFYGQAITYAGLALDCDLNFPKGVTLRSVTQIWNDATAKDFSVRAAADPTSSFVQLDTDTANTQTSRVSTDINLELPPGGRIRIVYANYTAGKSVQIVVVAEEI